MPYSPLKVFKLLKIFKVFKLFLLCMLLLTEGSHARKGKSIARVSYANTYKILPKLWTTRYPIRNVRFLQFKRKRVLRAYVKGRRVYYFKFAVLIPRLKRNEEEPPEVDKDLKPRHAIIWIRYRRNHKVPYDLTFAREDLLPGRYRRYVRL